MMMEENIKETKPTRTDIVNVFLKASYAINSDDKIRQLNKQCPNSENRVQGEIEKLMCNLCRYDAVLFVASMFTHESDEIFIILCGFHKSSCVIR